MGVKTGNSARSILIQFFNFINLTTMLKKQPLPETLVYKHVYTPDELARKQMEFNANYQKLEGLKDDKKTAGADYTAKITAQEGLLKLLSRQVSEGNESRTVQAIKRKNFDAGVWEYVNPQNDEIYHTEPLQGKDWQMSVEEEIDPPKRDPNLPVDSNPEDLENGTETIIDDQVYTATVSPVPGLETAQIDPVRQLPAAGVNRESTDEKTESTTSAGNDENTQGLSPKAGSTEENTQNAGSTENAGNVEKAAQPGTSKKKPGVLKGVSMDEFAEMSEQDFDDMLKGPVVKNPENVPADDAQVLPGKTKTRPAKRTQPKK